MMLSFHDKILQHSLKHGDVSMNQKMKIGVLKYVYISFENFFAFCHFVFSSKTERKKKISLHLFKKDIRLGYLFVL